MNEIQQNNFQLIYIFHSGFVISSNKISILIDYWEDTESGFEGYIHQQVLPSSKKLYILSSHGHHDHFNPEILSWKKQHPDISYIFSKDILNSGLVKESDAIYLKNGDIFQDNNLRIKAFGSTDIGISFVMEINNKKIFHAGDFNNWHWDEESTKEEIHLAETTFSRKLKILEKAYPKFDLSMFPVDPRLGKNYTKGAQQFIKTIQTDIFAPMHFGINYNGANAFAPFAENQGCHFMTIKNKGTMIYF